MFKVYRNGHLDSELSHIGDKGDSKQNSAWNREIPIKILQRTDSERAGDKLPPEFKTKHSNKWLQASEAGFLHLHVVLATNW